MTTGDQGVASPGYCDDTVGGPDSLGVDAQAAPFARLIMDARLSAPLCLGLLGPSGAGKSFFMERLAAMVAALQGAPGHCDQAVCVRFNAWRHARGDAGAELVARVTGREGDPDRVVLLVEDLDRCPTTTVVQVLEAIHLRLARDRLAVVVAADARWLLRAIAVHHRELLDGAEDAYRDAVLHGHLEKVFQITYALAPMEPAAFASHVERLAEDGSGDGGATPALSGSPPFRAVTITGDEQRFLATLLPLLNTPRIAGRVVNAFRLIKARAPRATQDVSFEAHEAGRFRPVLLLLAMLFGRRHQAEELLRRMVQKEPPFQTPKLQLHMAIKNLAQAEGQDPEVHDSWIELGHLVERLAGDLLVEQCTCEAAELARYSLVTGQVCHRW